jgi:photosystem II stability/assembly factor-like uncharacterized protein
MLSQTKALAQRWAVIGCLWLGLSILHATDVFGGESGTRTPKARLIPDHLFDVDFVNENLGWAVGYFGTVLKTTDGGKTWTRLGSGTDALLKSVDFLDDQYGWAVGLRGTIIHTEDSGKTWRAQNSGSQTYLRGVKFVDRNRGWVVGELGLVLFTVDGGKSWQTSAVEKKDIRYNAVDFPNPELGWVVGEFGTILSTKDGGRSWRLQKNPRQATLTGVRFLDGRNGFVVGIDGAFLRTENGGDSWVEVPSGTEKHLFGVSVLGSGHAVAVGDGQILVKRGGQVSRFPGDIKVQGVDLRYSWLYSVRFLNEKRGWAVGKEGAILKTLDGGITWDLAIDWNRVKEASP